MTFFSAVLTYAICRTIIATMAHNYSKDLVGIIKQRRISIPLTLNELSSLSGVSQSELTRIEREDRFPSARILRKIAKPLGFEENELFMLAGYLSYESPANEAGDETSSRDKRLDPYVAGVLSQEPVGVQRAIIGILSLLRNIAKSTEQTERN